jgi:mannose/cellobiose epimerase-like protein (N-acyl-D-glucosamine 2-epimerase family)
VELFQHRFFDQSAGVLREYFEADWRPAAPPEGTLIEPGHHFEWSWLLAEAERLGAGSARREGEALYRFGLSHGLDPAGFAVDELDTSGRVVRASRRTWPQTELIKAYVTAARHGDAEAAESAGRTAGAVLDTYLATAVQGLWIDQYDGDGRPAADHVPASTLYHVALAFRELCALDAETG